MIISLDTILKNMNHEIEFEDGTILQGNIEYISSHFGDGVVVNKGIAKSQPRELSRFFNDYNIYNEKYKKRYNEDISITDYYKIWSKYFK